MSSQNKPQEPMINSLISPEPYEEMPVAPMIQAAPEQPSFNSLFESNPFRALEPFEMQPEQPSSTGVSFFDTTEVEFVQNKAKEVFEVEKLPKDYTTVKSLFESYNQIAGSGLPDTVVQQAKERAVEVLNELKSIEDYDNQMLAAGMGTAAYFVTGKEPKKPGEYNEFEVRVARALAITGTSFVNALMLDVPMGVLNEIDPKLTRVLAPENTFEEALATGSHFGGFLAGPMKIAKKALSKPSAALFEKIAGKSANTINAKVAQIVVESLNLGAAMSLSAGNEDFIKAMHEDKKLDKLASGFSKKLGAFLEGSIVFGARYAGLKELVTNRPVMRALINVAVTNAWTRAVDPEAEFNTYLMNTLMDVYFSTHGAVMDYKARKALDEFTQKEIGRLVTEQLKSKAFRNVAIERMIELNKSKIDLTDIKRRFVKDWSRLYQSEKNEIPAVANLRDLHKTLQVYAELNRQIAELKRTKGKDPETRKQELELLEAEAESIARFISAETGGMEVSWGRGGIALKDVYVKETFEQRERKAKDQRRLEIYKIQKEFDAELTKLGELNKNPEVDQNEITLTMNKIHVLLAKKQDAIDSYIKEFMPKASEASKRRVEAGFEKILESSKYAKMEQREQSIRAFEEAMKNRWAFDVKRAQKEVINEMTKSPFDAIDAEIFSSLTPEQIKQLPDRIRKRLLRVPHTEKDISSFDRWFTTKEFWALKYGDPEVLKVVSGALDAKSKYNYVIATNKALAYETGASTKYLTDLYKPLDLASQNRVRLALKEMEIKSAQIRTNRNTVKATKMLERSIAEKLSEQEKVAFEGTRLYFDQIREKLIDYWMTKTIKQHPTIEPALVELEAEVRNRSAAIRRKKLSINKIAAEIGERRGVNGQELSNLYKRLHRLRNWGIEDFVTRLEIGNFTVVRSDGHVVAVYKDLPSAEAYAARNHTKGYKVLIEDYISIDPLKTRSKVSSLEGEPRFFNALQEYARRVHKRLILDPVIDDINNLTSTKALPRNVYEGLKELRDNIRGYKTGFDKSLEGFASRTLHLPYGTVGATLRTLRTVEAALKLGWRPDAAMVNLFYGHAHTIAKTGFVKWFQAKKFLKTEEGRKFIHEEEPYFGSSYAEFELSGKLHDILPWWHPMKLFSMPEHQIRRYSVAANYLALKDIHKADLQTGKMTEMDLREAARRAMRFQSFVYDVAALPEIYSRSGEVGRTALQFKSYLIQEMQFLSSLTPGEAARYMGLNMLVGGYRAMLVTLKSMPMLAATGLSQKIDMFLTTQVRDQEIGDTGAYVEDVLAGVPGLLGMDFSAAASVQLPTEAKDWIGPGFSDLWLAMKKIGYIYTSDKENLWSRTIYDKKNNIPFAWKAGKVLDEASDFFVLGRRIGDSIEALTNGEMMNGVIWIRDRKTGKLKYPATIDPQYTALITLFSGSTKKRKDLSNALNVMYTTNMKRQQEKAKLKANVIKILMANKEVPESYLKKMVEYGVIEFIDEGVKLAKLPPHLRMQEFMSKFEKVEAQEMIDAYRLNENYEPLIEHFIEQLNQLNEE